MGIFDMFVNQQKKTEEIMSKDLEKYVTASMQPIDSDLLEIKEKLDTYKGIIVFPEALDYYPIDRPQNILRTFARKGFLCFFCTTNFESKLKEVEPNLFVVTNQERLLPLLKNRKVLFLITYFLQYTFAKMVDDRIIWIDIMGKIDKYKYYNNYSIGVYKDIMKEALIATYRCEEYKIYYEGVRDNVILMKDGINEMDFINPKNKIADNLRKYLFMNKKVIGYYGNIDKNINFNLIKKIDSLNTFVIVLIGKLDDSIDLRDYSLKNTVILPSIDYSNLKYYIPYFDYVFFPLLNDNNHIIYNKVLERSAMKKHIISFENKELLEFNLPNLILVKNTDELIKTISEKEVKDYNLSEEINKTLIKYKWENIISKVLPL